MLTFDQIMSLNGSPDEPGMRLGFTREFAPYLDRSGKMRARKIKTYDSTGAFMVGELERLDQRLHLPLASVTWQRDIDLREDVTPGDEVSSFTTQTFGSSGGLGTGNSIGTGKAWAGKQTTQITNVSVDIQKITQPLTIWSMEVKYTIPELVSAAQVGRPIDDQKIEGMKLKYQMDVDEQVYYGDSSLSNMYGLLRLDSRTDAGQVTDVHPLPNGAAGSPNWSQKTPAEILNDFNYALSQVWTASAYAIVPSDILIPPAQYTQIATQLVSLAGSQSVLSYILENNLLTREHGKALSIRPCKWNVGAGVGGTIGVAGTVDRMCVYTKDMQRVRFPITILSRTPVQYDGLYHKFTYWGRIGVVEPVYPECCGYFDGL